MKITLSALFLLLCTSASLASAQSVQREDCNQKAEGKLGSERARIISACIRRNASLNTVPPMLGKITECNRKAGDMQGDERVKFVNKCMDTN